MSGDKSSIGNENEGFCIVCKSSAKKKCSACKIVYYCNREHQKSDWKSHSKNCRGYKLVEDSTVGRRYVATRKIENNEIVICDNEALLLTVPLMTAPVCLNCYVPLKADSARPCNHCGWPLCLKCTKHGPECELTIKYRKSKVKIERFSMPNPFYNLITILRAVALREKNLKKYRKLLNLEDHYETMKEQFMRKAMPWLVNYQARFIRNFMKIDDLDEIEISRIIGIVGINGFETQTSNYHDVIIVFDRASYIEHNCHPNCSISCHCDANDCVRMVVRAIETIKKGHPISITYTDPLQGTAQRRSILSSSKCFDCTCERCKDPTEYGTMFSAVKCFEKDCTGYMLPPTFIVSMDEKIPDYVCDKCSLETLSGMIDEMMAEISMKFSTIKPSDDEHVNLLKKFISDQKKILHENHYLIFKAELQLALAFLGRSKKLTSLTDELLEECGMMVRKVVHLIDILGRADVRARAATRLLDNMIIEMLAMKRTDSWNPALQRTLEHRLNDALKDYMQLMQDSPMDPLLGSQK